MTFKQLIDYYGTLENVGKNLSPSQRGGKPLTKQAIFAWKKRGIPRLRAIEIETLTNGILRRDK